MKFCYLRIDLNILYSLTLVFDSFKFTHVSDWVPDMLAIAYCFVGMVGHYKQKTYTAAEMNTDRSIICHSPNYNYIKYFNLLQCFKITNLRNLVLSIIGVMRDYVFPCCAAAAQ